MRCRLIGLCGVWSPSCYWFKSHGEGLRVGDICGGIKLSHQVSRLPRLNIAGKYICIYISNWILT
jgi:hypothetical protein